MISGTITPGVGADLYRFDGTAGQRLVFNNLSALGTTDGSTNWILYNTTNGGMTSSALLYQYSTPNLVATLPTTGTYLLLINGRNPGELFSYSFKVLDTVTNATSVTPGTTVSGNLNPGRSVDLYTLSGTAGQRLFFDGQNAHGVDVRVIMTSPSGVNVFNLAADQDQAPITLPETGIYRIMVAGNSDTAGAYSFRLLDGAAATPVTLGTVVNGTLPVAGSTNLYRVTGSAGQRLYFSNLTPVGTATDNTQWVLYGVNSQPLGSGYLFNNSSRDFEVTLPTDGTFLLAAIGSLPSGGATAYSFNVISNPTALPLNSTVNGNLNPSHTTDVYTFTGSFGQQLWFDGIDAHNSQVYVTLSGPTGTRIFTNYNADSDVAPFTLSVAGTYRLTVTGAPEPAEATRCDCATLRGNRC